MPEYVCYVGWLDHDALFQNPAWLEESLARFESGVDVLQPFERIEYLDLAGSMIFAQAGAAATGAAASTGKAAPA